MAAYYNEHDPFAAAWLRELIRAGLIADGDVDERSIVEVRADDVRGYTQAHWFAGFGGWSYALRLAGWPDERAVWTGSCPCQPFSASGKGGGFSDPRDLWPVWFALIRQCRPIVVFGEQVEAAIRHGWLDRLCDDLEREDYAVGACSLPAASVGAFHIRQRLWFVAESHTSGCGERAEQHGDTLPDSADRHPCRQHVSGHGRHDSDRLADPTRRDQQRYTGEPRSTTNARGGEAWPANGHAVGSASGMGDSMRERRQQDDRGAFGDEAADGRQPNGDHLAASSSANGGFWSGCDWLPCIDGKARPVEPGTFPLAYGVSNRVGRLRGYGNAIVPQVAAAFIDAYLDLDTDHSDHSTDSQE